VEPKKKLNRKQRSAAKKARLAAGWLPEPKARPIRSPRGYVPKPVDGQTLPSSVEGWIPDKPGDGLICVAVRCIRFDDASTRKFYRCVLRPAEQKKLKRQAKATLRKLKADDAKSAKRRVRALLVIMGKA